MKINSIIPSLKTMKMPIFMAIIFGVLYGISSGLGIPVLLKIVADKVFSVENISLPTLLGISCIPVGVMGIRAISAIINNYYVNWCGQKLLNEMRLSIFKKIQRLPLEYFKQTPPGEVMTRALSDTAILQGTIIDVAQEIIIQPIALLGAIGALIFICYTQSDSIFLLLFLCIAAIAIFPIRFIGKKMRDKSLKLQHATENMITKLEHNLSAIQEIRAFSMESSEIECYSKACYHLMKSVMNAIKYQIIMSPIIEVLASAGIGIAIFYAYQKHISTGVFLGLAGALYMSYAPIKRMAAIYNKIKTGGASFDRIISLLDKDEKIHEPANPLFIPELKGNIQFHHVSFSYDGKEEALSDINLSLEHGKVYAIVGSSGAGKSTLVNLILRFYDVSKGNITIDSIDIRDMLTTDLRKNISYVPQMPSIINGTVSDNIRWSAPQATEDEVIAAAKKAYAHEFISLLPQGYQTLVGEDGTRLSGGQRQRLALARAFLRDAPILLLDEATSSLDSKTEYEIHTGIENLIKNRTAVLISHRFTMMHMVDTAIVLDKGKVIEVGSPSDLSKDTSSVYYDLYSKQI